MLIQSTDALIHFGYTRYFHYYRIQKTRKPYVMIWFLNLNGPQLDFAFSVFHKKSTGYFVRYHYEDTEGLFCLFSNSWNFTLNEAYLDIKEIYGILKEQENSEYFKSLKPERALDLPHPMLFFR